MLNNRREPWSSAYGKRLTFRRLLVRIVAPYTGWTFFTYICSKICNVYLKRPKINKKRPGHYNNDQFVQHHKNLPQFGSKFCPIQNKPSKNSQRLLKFCQSGKISPHLVTLIPFSAAPGLNPKHTIYA